MKFGYIPCTEDPPSAANMPLLFEEITREIKEAEKAGFDGIFLTEHHQQSNGYLSSPLTILAWIAEITKAALGTSILLLPLYHPVRVAEDVAIIDNLSGGRVILGVGMGWARVDFEAFGILLKERVSRMNESLEVLVKAWTQDIFSFNGKHFSLRGLSIHPRPVQKPHPPLWIGGSSDNSLMRAVSYGNRWLNALHFSRQASEMFAKRYVELAKKVGRTPRMATLRECFIAKNTDTAERLSAAGLLHSHRFYWSHGAYNEDPTFTGVERPEDISLDLLKRERFILGDPDDVIRQIEAWQKLGFDYMILRFRHAGASRREPSHEETLEAIRVFGQEVIPHFSGAD